MPGELCAACSTITLPMLLEGFQHPLDYNQVLQSKDHCRLCDLVMDAYDSHDSHVYTKNGKREICNEEHRGPLVWRIVPPGPGVRSGMFCADSNHYGKTLTVSASEESSVFRNDFITHRNLQDADSPRNFRLLRNWFQECLSSHEECQRGRYSKTIFDDISCSTRLPFRVIDLGPPDGTQRARLFTTHNKVSGRYFTLSHRWGIVIPTRTTKATVSAWHEELPEHQLPKTFQDAIRLTREFGERFLWIDSLCIVQDDDAEKSSQLRLMGTIFEGSYCTIAAVEAKGADGLAIIDSGLFISGPRNTKIAKLQLRHQPPATDTYVNEPGITNRAQGILGQENESSLDEVSDIFIQPVPQPNHPFSAQVQQTEWHSRGWVFQERELSRRCIFFTQKELGWRCNRYWNTEQSGTLKPRPTVSTLGLGISITCGDFTFDSDYNLLKTWQSTVEDYSGSDLTHVSDKHVALMGLEERLGTATGAIFHFGIIDFGPTSEHLHCQLLWIPTISRGSLTNGGTEFGWPSWSWLCVDGTVRWTHNEQFVHPELLSQLRFDRQPISKEAQELHISGLHQTIKIGRSIEDIPHFTESERWAPETHFGWSELMLDPKTNVLLSSTGDEMIGWVVLDTTSKELGEIVACPLLQYLRQDDEEEPMCVEFLALAKVPLLNDSSTERYRRVGRGRVLKTAVEWMQDCEQGDLIVV